MRNKVKRTLSFLLTFVMLCSLLPMTAMAKELQPGEVAASKTASYDAENHEVTITMTVEGKEASQITPSKADVVLVVDNSGSMASSVGEPCKTPSSEFESAGWGWVECPECGARYYQVLTGWFVPDFCTGEKGKEPRIDTAKKVGKTFADSILSGENDNQMAVIGFAHGERDWFESTDAIRQKLDLTDNVTDVKNTLDEMVADGGTDYTSALQEAYDMLAGRSETDRPGYVVFISDGAPGKQGESIGDSDWDGSEQAQAIKDAGYQLYTIGIALDDEADDYLESLASDNHYQNVTGTNYASELEELLKEWAEEINTVPAGTDAVLVDTISDQFTLKEDQNVTGLTFDYANNRVTWNVGEITEEGKAVSFVVIPKDGVYGDNIPTNTEAELTYTDAKGVSQTLDVANATVNIPAPVVETVILTYDANGGTGAPETATVNKNTEDYVLNTDTTPTHEPVDGRDVEFKGWSADEAVTNQVYEKDNVPATVTTIDIAEENVTVYAVWVYGDPVDPVDPPEPPTWDHSKDKTATELDNNFNSRVTLSLPSAEKELVSDVVFVLDKSSCKEDVTDNALKMLADLGASVKNTGAKIKVGAVQFAGRAVVSCGLTELTEEAIAEGGVIEKGLTEPKISDGTNLQAGLLEAQKMLAADTDVEDSRKYVIVITDGLTRQFLAEDGTLMTIYNALDADGSRVWGSPSGWCTANRFEDGVYGIPGGDWDTYYEAVKANVAKDGDTYAHDYDVYGSTPAGENIPDSYVPQGKTSLQHALCLDRAIYEADKVYSELKEANYHCYAVFAGTPEATNNELGKAFVEHLNEHLNGDDVLDFGAIKNDIYYLLDAGSQVVDIIGQGKDNKGNDYNFDVVNLENMTITVGGVELKKEKMNLVGLPEGSTTYGFFEGEIADGHYDFVVTYYPEGVADADDEKREHFVWDINVPVSNFAPVQFSYYVQLTNPQKVKGTYTVATNVEAVLTPVDSNKEPGKPEKFPVPELTYEVKGGGSGEDYRYVNVTVVGKGDVDYKCGDHKGTITEKDGTELLTLDLFENSMKFNMEPASGWKLDRIEVNGKDVGKDLEYKMIFDEVTGDQMDIDVKIVFKEKSDGGSGGGSHRPSNKPDKTPEALNGDDHFDYVVGYSDGLVHPERNITRAEVASIFFRLLQDDVREKNLTDQNPFNDVFTDDWFNVAVSTMYDMDIVYGRDNNNFDPNAYITRAEFAAIAARFDSEGYSGENLFTDIDGHWAANQINRAAEKGWISGYPDGTFGPDRYITRAEAVTMINRVLNRLPESADALHEDMNVFPDNMDTTAWYYLAIQEATSSHEYEKDKDGVYETWTDVLPDRDWAQYLKLN
ncbi:S-layer homology domain-containing protein [Anaerotignum lactatifermentans]|uniref:S-layer homology domain-containing protein n=1 Tax=Anaerotignum lactatifermentans TaxID=160404 RepID=UPI00248F425A|nr:S-layer homology domain-containing protein [Anaerotignum lactatifermentans]